MFSKLPIVPVKQPEITEKTTLLKNPQKFSALAYLNEGEDYQKSGYCSSVLLRTGIVRFAFFKLFGTGIVALISACRALNGKVAYSCALSAAVNAVACFHYYFIWSTRRQELPLPTSTWRLNSGVLLAPPKRIQFRGKFCCKNTSSTDGDSQTGRCARKSS